MNATPVILLFCLVCCQLPASAISLRKNLEPNVIIENANIEFGFFHERATHYDAQRVCREWGDESGSLANIKTLAVQKTIHRHLRKMLPYDISSKWKREGTYAVGFHVGGALVGGNWMWKDSTPVTMRGGGSWHRWGPQRPGREQCMSILILRTRFMQRGYHLGTWVDNACDSSKYFICQREKVTSSSKFKKSAIQEVPQICDSRQRILPFRHSGCDKERDFKEFDIGDWIQEDGAKWNITNTGKDIEIRMHPEGSLKTIIRGSDNHLIVDKILLKWGKHHRTGSEHSFGPFHFAGEIQIFHKHHELGSHAISFFLRERHNPPNLAWTSLLEQTRDIHAIGVQTTHETPPMLKSLLSGDRYGPHHAQHDYRTGQYIRYEGSTTEQPCEKYTWTVYERPLYLSTSQMEQLRSLDLLPSTTDAFAQSQMRPNPTITTCRYQRTVYG